MPDIDHVKGKYPTPFGAVTIEHKKDASGRIKTTVDAPEKVEIMLDCG